MLSHIHSHHNAHQRAAASLLLCAVLWGANTALLQAVTTLYPPLSIVALRFAFAALGMWLCSCVFAPGVRLSWHGWRQGMLLGLLLALAFACYTLGVKRTSVAHTSLLASVYVVLVPVCAWLIGRERVNRRTSVALLCSVAGTLVLAAESAQGSGKGDALGDALILASAAVFALHTVLLSADKGEHNVLALSAAQMTMVSAVMLPVALAHDGLVVPSGAVVGALVWMGLGATALCYTLQMAARRHLGATEAALLFALEPVAGVAVVVLLGWEALTVAGATGGALLLVGVLIAEGVVRRPRRASEQDPSFIAAARKEAV